MGNVYYQLYYHFIWGTYKRLSLIDPEIEQDLKILVRDKIIEKESQLLGFGCTDDHLHLIVKLHPKISVSEIIGQVKGYSSYVIANNLHPENGFRWQKGYGALTISEKDLSRLLSYVEQQKNHHSQDNLLIEYEITNNINHP